MLLDAKLRLHANGFAEFLREAVERKVITSTPTGYRLAAAAPTLEALLAWVSNLATPSPQDSAARTVLCQHRKIATLEFLEREYPGRAGEQWRAYRLAVEIVSRGREPNTSELRYAINKIDPGHFTTNTDPRTTRRQRGAELLWQVHDYLVGKDFNPKKRHAAASVFRDGMARTGLKRPTLHG